MRSIHLIAAGLVVTSAYALETKQLPREMRVSDPFSMPLIIEAGESDWSTYGSEAPATTPVSPPHANAGAAKPTRSEKKQALSVKEPSLAAADKDPARIGEQTPAAAAIPAQTQEPPKVAAVPVPPPSPAKTVAAAPSSDASTTQETVLSDARSTDRAADPSPTVQAAKKQSDAKIDTAEASQTEGLPPKDRSKVSAPTPSTASDEAPNRKFDADKLPKIDAAAIEKGLAGVIATPDKPAEAPKAEKPAEQEKPKPHFTGNQGKAKPIVLASVSKPAGTQNGDLMRTVRYFDAWNLTCELNLGKNERICAVEQTVTKENESFTWRIATAQDKKAIVHFEFTAKAEPTPGLKVIIAGFERSIPAEEWACSNDRCTAYFPIAGIVQNWFSGNPSVKFRYSVSGKPVELDATMGGFETAMRAASEDPIGIKAARATVDEKSREEKVASAESASVKR